MLHGFNRQKERGTKFRGWLKFSGTMTGRFSLADRQLGSFITLLTWDGGGGGWIASVCRQRSSSGWCYWQRLVWLIVTRTCARVTGRQLIEGSCTHTHADMSITYQDKPPCRAKCKCVKNYRCLNKTKDEEQIFRLTPQTYSCPSSGRCFSSPTAMPNCAKPPLHAPISTCT